MDRRGIVEVATGGGKTRLALACGASMAAESPTFEIVVPTTALADQWYVSIVEEGGVAPSKVATLTSRSRASDLRLFNIVVINSARRLDPSIWAEANRVLIVDECHRAGSRENSLSLEGHSKASLGLSATPERQYDAGFEEILVPALGPKIYRYGLTEATRDGVLNAFELSNVRVPLTFGERAEYDAASQRLIRAKRSGATDDVSLAILRQRARISANAVARLPAAVKIAESHPGARTLVFHETIQGAEALLSLLRSRGNSATIYHSKLGPAMRRENLRLFRRGVYDTLVTCRALDEGTNIPEVQVAIIAAASASERQRIQRLGRVLRPAAGKGTAQVYTLYATTVEEERLRDESQSLASVARTRWLKAEAT